VLCARLVDVFSSVPVGIFLVGDGYDLPDAEIEVVLVARCVVIQGLDLERHGDAARGQLQSKVSGVEARLEAVAGLLESSSFQAKRRCRERRVWLVEDGARAC
jgi:hypothetical protein